MVIFEYDKEADAAYIYLKYPIKEGEAKKTIALNDNIVLDFNQDQKLIGVEVLSASRVLSRKVLAEAKAV
ncbi:MAG: DUF2283 domain-containing protein [Candidatus Aenigmarchaeota archaeon]|nr:DUF2283 domain-containing protein [Candidatus Aenigmarchaeota archaeon]